MSTDPVPTSTTAAARPAQPKRYLDPKIDLAFKRVFGEHKNLLKSFLNALLPLPEDGQIDTLEYLPPEQVPEIPGFLKYSIVDVKCTDQNGRIFIVEMQMMWALAFEQRMVFSASQAYVKQMREGQSYKDLRPVYALAILNSKFDPVSGTGGGAPGGTPGGPQADYYHHYKIVNVERPQQTLKGLEFVFIELPKFKPESRTEKRLQNLWLRFLRETGAQTEQVIDPALMQDRDIAEALNLVEQAAFTEAELNGYHVALDRARMAVDIVADAEAKGKAEGELAKARAIAAILLTQGLALEQVAAATGLTVPDLQAL